MKPIFSAGALFALAFITCASLPDVATASMLKPDVAPAASSGETRLLQPEKNTLATLGRNPTEFAGYVEKLKAQAQQKDIDPETLAAAFTGVHFVDHVIAADRRQPESTIMLSDYLARVMPQSKIAQGRENLLRYHTQLTAVSQRYGIPPQIIVALWAMESNYGRLQGKEEVISALATLAFEGRREAFFTEQLYAALRILQQQHITVDKLKGSWAGAMGQTQFMPDSYLRYGADGDGDGNIDIWSNVDDVFASTANYLAGEGWQVGQGWGQEVQLPPDFSPGNAGLKSAQAKSISEWQSLRVRFTHTVTDLSQRAWIITPDDVEARSFIVYDNFRTIMHWNRSTYFALSIGIMADTLSTQLPQR